MNENPFHTIRYSKQGQVAQITLARPEVHNAFNSAMIGELLTAFGRVKDDPEVRVAVLTGEGKSFCAGADLNWMRRCAS